MNTVFLGGTCNNSTWRDELLPMLDSEKIDAFNPVVDDWNEEAQANEDYHKANDEYMLYVITPEMKGVYSIFEIAMLSCKKQDKLIVCFLNERNGLTFDPFVQKNIEKIKKDLASNGTVVLNSLEEVAGYFNNIERQNELSL